LTQRALQKPKTRERGERIELGEGGEKMQQGLAKLTLTVMEVVRQVLERQAMRRVESGTLSEMEVERMGVAFMQLSQEMGKLTKSLGLGSKDLDVALGSLLKTGGKASLVDVLDRLIDKGAVVAGQVTISVSDVDLIGVDLLAMLYPIYGERRWLDDRPAIRID
jgi:hypothetical protein